MSKLLFWKAKKKSEHKHDWKYETPEHRICLECQSAQAFESMDPFSSLKKYWVEFYDFRDYLKSKEKYFENQKAIEDHKLREIERKTQGDLAKSKYFASVSQKEKVKE